MFEHKHEPLLSRQEFVRRMVSYAAVAVAIIFGSIFIGMLGYHVYEGLSWVDSFVNAAMILGGMGPVNTLHTDAGKYFAGFYALYSGLVFLLAAGVLLAPVIHRFFHHFHLDIEDEETPETKSPQDNSE